MVLKNYTPAEAATWTEFLVFQLATHVLIVLKILIDLILKLSLLKVGILEIC